MCKIVYETLVREVGEVRSHWQVFENQVLRPNFCACQRSRDVNNSEEQSCTLRERRGDQAKCIYVPANASIRQLASLVGDTVALNTVRPVT